MSEDGPQSGSDLVKRLFVFIQAAAATGNDPECNELLQHMIGGIEREKANPPPPIPHVEPIDAPCSYCFAREGEGCKTKSGKKTKIHAARHKDADVSAVVKSGRCLNRLCCGGKVLTPNGEIPCPGCNGTMRDSLFKGFGKRLADG